MGAAPIAAGLPYESTKHRASACQQVRCINDDRLLGFARRTRHDVCGAQRNLREHLLEGIHKGHSFRNAAARQRDSLSGRPSAPWAFAPTPFRHGLIERNVEVKILKVFAHG